MKPTPSDPTWDDPRITAYVLGELDDQQRRQLEQQMVDDERLASAVAEARQIIDRVSRSLADEFSSSLSSHRREAIMQSQPPEPHDALHPPRPERRLPWRPLVLAASLLYLLGLGSGWLLSPVMTPDRRVASYSLAKTVDAQREPQPAIAQPARPAATDAPVPDEARPFSVSSTTAAPASGPAAIAPGSPAPQRMDFAGDYGGGYAKPGGGYAAGAGYGGQPTTLQSVSGMGGGMPGQARDEASGYGVASGGFQQQGQPAGTFRRNIDGERGLDARWRYADSREGLSQLHALEESDLDLGHGPGMAGDRFEPITDNAFRRVDEHPLSTFSIDVDTASYAKVRSFLLDQNALPRPDAVRIEELVNYFEYNYPPPQADDEHPFASHVEVTACPWNGQNRLARVAIKGREIERESRPAGNFVFLLDVSGSMNQPNKLPLVKRGMQLLLQQLNDQDRVAIVVYAGAAGLVLESTPGDRRAEVLEALERLSAGGSTNGGQGIQLAYSVARDHFIADGVNRVILCTDGDFNVGTTGTDSLVRMVEEEAKGDIYLSVLGFGMGNHNDAMLEQISGRGNGNYAFIDTEAEAHKVLVQQASGTLVTIAKDVKIQVEFNPAQVAAYRLIGYENRILAKEDFNDDTKDAGEIGAGHTVTALYELVPAGKQPEPVAPEVDPLRYQTRSSLTEAADTEEVLTLKLRYKQPDGDTSTLVQFPATDEDAEFGAASSDLQFAAAVAGFGMQLRQSPYKGDWTYAAIEETARSAMGDDPHGLRAEFIRLVEKAASLAGAAGDPSEPVENRP